MKKILTIAALTLAAVLTANASSYEPPKNEISISYGYGTHPEIALDFASAFADAIVGSNSSEEGCGVFSLTYMRNLNKNIGLGATLSYENLYKKDSNNEKYNENFLAIMPTARAYWFRSKMFGMYSRVAAGIALNIYDDYDANDGKVTKSGTEFAFHFAPVSMEIGSNKICGFLELGYGYQGIFNAGIKVGF